MSCALLGSACLSMTPAIRQSFEHITSIIDRQDSMLILSSTDALAVVLAVSIRVLIKLMRAGTSLRECALVYLLYIIMQHKKTPYNIILGIPESRGQQLR